MINNDTVFGEMTYDYGWTKKDIIILFDEKYEISCVASAYKEQGITDNQCQSYLQYKKDRSEIAENIEKELFEYCKSLKGIKLPEDIKPTELVFGRDGSIGLLFDCKWDADNGLVVCVKPTYKVGSQDIFL